MSDDFVANILASWEMADLLEKFESEDIDEDAFRALDLNSVKELIPKLGLRIKFWKKYCQFIQPNREEPAAASAADTVSVCSDSDLSITSAAIIRSRQNLKQVLTDNVTGKEILAVYESSNALNDRLRSKLTEIIINAELRNSTDHQISTDRFLQLRNEITELFPTEEKATYYIPYAKAGKVISQAKGKLWSKYYNTRRSLRNAGALIHAVAQVDPNDTIESVSADYTPSTDEKEKVEWLKNSQEPWNLVVEYWQCTSKARILEFQNSISNYIGVFPVLKQNLGYTLLEIDFAAKYSGKELNLFSNWPKYCKKILDYAKRSNKPAYKNYLDVLTVNDTDEIRTIVALRLLPLLLPVITVQTKKKACWRPSKVEVQDGFITQINDVGDLQPTIERRRQKMEKKGVTVQAVVIIVASSLQKVEASYVAIEGTTYLLDTPLKAIDICFKAVHALDLLYPLESEQVWLFLEKALYDIEIPSDRNKKLSVGLNTLLHDLDQE